MIPHVEQNMQQISVWKNPQKQRKPSAQRAKNYWDLRGRWQREYDERLDLLPDEGVADTVAGEIFRAATKLYYDFHNNAMVNNTSGAINYLAKAGVLPTTKQNEDDCDIFGTIYPYTIGIKIHFGELSILYAIEAMLDRTIEFLRAHPKLDIAPNTMDYHDLRDRDAKMCLERCAIRNRMAQQMNADAMRWANEMESKRTKKKKKKKAQGLPKAQDHVVGSASSSANKENNNKKKKRKKKNSNNKGSKSKDIAGKFSKLGLCD